MWGAKQSTGMFGVSGGSSAEPGDAQQCWQLSQTRGGFTAWGTPCSAISGVVESLPLQ